MQKIKKILIVLLISIMLAGLTFFLCVSSSEFDTYKMVPTILLTVWAFFIVPSFMYAFAWAKVHLGRMDMNQSFRMGYLWGDLFLLLIVICAPVSGTLWFVIIGKTLLLAHKKKMYD